MGNSISAKIDWSDAELQLLRTTNAKFIEMELRMQQLYPSILSDLKGLVNKNAIDGYNTYWRLSLFSNDDTCNSRHGVSVGDPFYDNEMPFILSEQFPINTETGYNWNEYAMVPHFEHPLAKEHLCYTMHWIVLHAEILTWEDIKAIDNVWLELKVDYQIFSNLNTTGSM